VNGKKKKNILMRPDLFDQCAVIDLPDMDGGRVVKGVKVQEFCATRAIRRSAPRRTLARRRRDRAARYYGNQWEQAHAAGRGFQHGRLTVCSVYGGRRDSPSARRCFGCVRWRALIRIAINSAACARSRIDWKNRGALRFPGGGGGHRCKKGGREFLKCSWPEDAYQRAGTRFNGPGSGCLRSGEIPIDLDGSGRKLNPALTAGWCAPWQGRFRFL